MTKAAEASESEWTIGRVVKWATDDFRARGIESPRLDAEVLLAHALGCSRTDLLIRSTEVLDMARLGRFRDFVKRRRTREPVAYLRGEREFYGRTFRVDARVLVPRPDTEILVEVALERTRERDLSLSALDLCTGSGCVAVTIAKERPTARIVASDVSEGALAVARDNALRLGAYNVQFLESDLFASVPSGPFDLVTANPPYIEQEELARLPEDVRNFEPRLALDGGADGLMLVRRIADESRRHLEVGGVLALEVGAGQAARAAECLAMHEFVRIEVKRDYGGHERVVSGVWGG